MHSVRYQPSYHIDSVISHYNISSVSDMKQKNKPTAVYLNIDREKQLCLEMLYIADVSRQNGRRLGRQGVRLV